MRFFYSDCFGHLCDHNGIIGTSYRPSMEYAVEILNKQQQQLEDVETLKQLCIDLLSAADKCAHEPYYIVQPFIGIVKKHATIINRLQLIR